MRYRVRFHLAQGQNFMKWQVKDIKTDEVRYFEPDLFFLTMTNCKLRNQPTTAKKIHDGANKTVCAWIDCESVEINKSKYHFNDQSVRYNPKVNPYWELMSSGENIDGYTCDSINTINRRIYPKGL